MGVVEGVTEPSEMIYNSKLKLWITIMKLRKASLSLEWKFWLQLTFDYVIIERSSKVQLSSFLKLWRLRITIAIIANNVQIFEAYPFIFFWALVMIFLHWLIYWGSNPTSYAFENMRPCIGEIWMSTCSCCKRRPEMVLLFNCWKIE